MVQFLVGTKRLWVAIAGLVVIVVLVFFPDLHRGPAGVVERPVAVILSSVQNVLSSMVGHLSDVWTDYIALVDLHQDNVRLRAELEHLTRERDALREAGEENSRLQALLDFQTSTPVASHAARVTGRDPSRWYQSVTIDRGSTGGALVDRGVHIPSGIVGTIVKTFPSASVVLLISDRHSAVPVLVQRTREEGIVEGSFGNRLRLKYLPPSSDIQSGDVIMTSGLTDPFPKGLMVGTVSRVERREGDLYPDVEVVPAADLSHLEHVLVLDSPPGS